MNFFNKSCNKSYLKSLEEKIQDAKTKEDFDKIAEEINVYSKLSNIKTDMYELKYNNRIKYLELLLKLSSLSIIVWGTVKTLKFEQTGSVTSTFGKTFLNCFRNLF